LQRTGPYHIAAVRKVVHREVTIAARTP